MHRLTDFVECAEALRARRRIATCDALVAHARAHSPFYREWDGEPLTKTTMMERFDDIVTDPRLRREALLAHVEQITSDELYLGRYRVMTTSGSSGRKGLFVYDRPEWVALMSQFLRYSEAAGSRPRFPAAAAGRVRAEPERHAHEPPGAALDRASACTACSRCR